jgi:hypothetical protein
MENIAEALLAREKSLKIDSYQKELKVLVNQLKINDKWYFLF